MTDIVDRLNDSLSAGYSELRKEAAQEIFQLRKERDALRDKIAEMEKQEPVAWMDNGTCRAGSKATAHRVVTNETKRDMPASVAASFSAPLYALPGAKGEEK